ncbi:MAG: hypothetical protein U1B77_00170, partial [Dehalococcoidales bacterium]|nr:hypothetical protein [Dehalococcoidales bacterium]
YVANPTDTGKEYTLMAVLSKEGRLISETALPVFGHAWFTVEPGDFIRLRGAFRFDETDVDLTVHLIERETEEAVDSVTTRLASGTSASAYPPWPGSPGTPGTSTDWLSALLPVMMMGFMGVAMVKAVRPEEEKEAVPVPITEKERLLPPGRKER